MHIENKDFWEKENVIESQNIIKNSSDFELFMMEKAKQLYAVFGTIQKIKIFGCGTGREIESIAQFYQPSQIVASDISKNMIAKCDENLKLWKLNSITETLAIDAIEYNKVSNSFELVTFFNSMMTYVISKQDRITIFNNAYQILKPNGVVVGTVHNQEGTFLKTMFFKIRNIFSFIYGEKAGIREINFHGYKLKGYYYTKKELLQDIQKASFRNIEIYSLEEYHQLKNSKYNRKKGYNNLIFIAQK
ncbi:MAG: Demethylmenaquinone methyltransferase [Bacteroidota bacterium]|jgi:SAM-dependent methyltransferase